MTAENLPFVRISDNLSPYVRQAMRMSTKLTVSHSDSKTTSLTWKSKLAQLSSAAWNICEYELVSVEYDNDELTLSLIVNKLQEVRAAKVSK